MLILRELSQQRAFRWWGARFRPTSVEHWCSGESLTLSCSVALESSQIPMQEHSSQIAKPKSLDHTADPRPRHLWTAGLGSAARCACMCVCVCVVGRVLEGGGRGVAFTGKHGHGPWRLAAEGRAALSRPGCGGRGHRGLKGWSSLDLGLLDQPEPTGSLLGPCPCQQRRR